MKTEQELQNDLEDAYEKENIAFQKAPPNMDFRQFEEYMKPTSSKVSRISKELRMIKTPTYSELPDYGDIMSLEDFIETVNDGGFIDYDGFGKYVKDGKKSDIDIYPSDVKRNKVRKDFDTIIWFNR